MTAAFFIVALTRMNSPTNTWIVTTDKSYGDPGYGDRSLAEKDPNE